MTNSMSRRDALAAGAAATIGACVFASTSEAQTSSSSRSQVGEETKSLDTLYQDALAEGGDLIVYAGGISLHNKTRPRTPSSHSFQK
jgi:hypothetical protein